MRILVLLLLILAAPAHAQDVLWSRDYADSTVFFGAARAGGDGYVLVGQKTRSSEANIEDGVILRLSGNGETLARYLTRLPHSFGYMSIVPRSGGGFFAIGRSRRTDSLIRGAYVARLDSAGGFVSGEWIGDSIHYPVEVEPTRDGGFVLLGIRPDPTFSLFFTEVVKCDASGVVEWSRTVSVNNDMGAWAIRPVSDGGYVVVTNVRGGSSPSIGVTRLAASGDSLWSSVVSAEREIRGHDIIEMTSGALLVAGGSIEFPFLYELDGATGQLVEQTMFADTLGGQLSVIERLPNGFVVGALWETMGNTSPLIRGLDDDGREVWRRLLDDITGESSMLRGIEAFDDHTLLFMSMRGLGSSVALMAVPVSSVEEIELLREVMDLR